MGNGIWKVNWFGICGRRNSPRKIRAVSSHLPVVTAAFLTAGKGALAGRKGS